MSPSRNVCQVLTRPFTLSANMIDILGNFGISVVHPNNLGPHQSPFTSDPASNPWSKMKNTNNWATPETFRNTSNDLILQSRSLRSGIFNRVLLLTIQFKARSVIKGGAFLPPQVKSTTHWNIQTPASSLLSLQIPQISKARTSTWDSTTSASTFCLT